MQRSENEHFAQSKVYASNFGDAGDKLLLHFAFVVMDADPCANVANALEELKIGTEEAMKHQARTSLGKKRMKIKIKSNFLLKKCNIGQGQHWR